MSRWIQWRFFAPRVLLFAVTALALQYAVGLVVRSCAKRMGTELLGTDVDVTHARLSLADRTVVLSGLRVANPCYPNGSALTAECCELKLDATPLLYKQTIIDQARLSGIRIGAEATEHTVSDSVSGSKKLAAKVSGRWFDDRAVTTASKLLANINERFEHNYVRQLDSVKLSTACCTRFPDRITAIESRAAELIRLTEELEKKLDAASVNQLRHDKTLNDLPANVATLRRELDEISADVGHLPLQLDKERRLIVAARRHDEQFLQTKLRPESVDQNLLNAYLLCDHVAQPLDELTNWMLCIRTIISTGTNARALHQRGEYVLFEGMRPAPNFLIRNLELRGEARIFGRPFEFQGLVDNLTTTPQIHGEPIRLRLSSTGTSPFELRATFDRTAGRMCDELLVDCSNVSFNEQAIGHDEALRVRIAPSVGSMTISMRIEGDKLSGDIQLVQNQVRIAPTLANELGKLPIESSMTGTLGGVNSLATRLSLHGTVEEPRCTLWSNLGPAVAEAMDRALQQHANDQARAVLAEARRHVDERLAALERQVADHRAKFALATGAMPERIDTIARLQTRRERISVEQLGRRLPSTSMLR